MGSKLEGLRACGWETLKRVYKSVKGEPHFFLRITTGHNSLNLAQH